jgi:parvulin-like peptidyl-prolyl isomerase
LALVVTTACSAEPPALTVGDVTFTEAELMGLSDTRRAQLAEITAFGLASAREELPIKLAPMLEQARDAALLKQFAAERILTESEVDDDQLRAHYLTNPALELTVRHVLFFSERWRPSSHRDQAQRKAEAASARLEAGEPFPVVAAELSEEPGAEGRQGLLQSGRKGSWVSEFWAAALALEPGEISPVTETQYGFHVLRLENREVVSFEEARPTVVAEVSELITSVEEVAMASPLRRPALPRSWCLPRTWRQSPETSRIGRLDGVWPLDSPLDSRAPK